MKRPPTNARARRAGRALIDELIDAARAGDRATFDRLFDLWFGAVLADAQRNLEDRRLAHELTGALLRRSLTARLAPTRAEDATHLGAAVGRAALAPRDRRRLRGRAESERS